MLRIAVVLITLSIIMVIIIFSYSTKLYKPMCSNAPCLQLQVKDRCIRISLYFSVHFSVYISDFILLLAEVCLFLNIFLQIFSRFNNCVWGQKQRSIGHRQITRRITPRVCRRTCHTLFVRQ